MIQYREKNHGSFEQEWLPHRGATDWWYITGYLQENNRPDRFYSYQFTLFNPVYFKKAFYVLHMAFTDIQSGEHFFEHKLRLKSRNIGVKPDAVYFLSFAQLQKHPGELILKTKTQKLELDLNLNYGKGAFWHGENGVLVMGLPDDPEQRSVYYSYPNMPTSGSVKFTENSGHCRDLEVMGKSWLDRQWGPFRLLDADSFWEWFSIRFFDNEEVMLFAFPQHPYFDGTFIDKKGRTRRVNDYKCNYHSLKKRGKLVFSYGWDIVLPGIKEENYRILPLNDGQYNGGYYEIMARVTNLGGTEVGYCFVELLPGIRPFDEKIGLLDILFSR